jgi:hypothetical protein
MRAALTLLVVIMAAPLGALGGGFTPENFDNWIRMRAGSDGKPVYWYASGHVMNNATGEVVALMEGIDTAIVLKDPTRPNTWIQLSRKIFISLDPRTGELQAGPDGKPRRPTAYPFQVKTYTLEGDEIIYSVESHDTASVFAEPPQRNYTARKLGSLTHYNYSMFTDRVRPDGKRSARFEVNDFFHRPDPGLSEQERYQYTWVGSGPGPIVASALSWRYSSFDDLPSQRLKDYIRSNAPLWLAPPKDMAEIAALKAQVPYALWQPK